MRCVRWHNTNGACGGPAQHAQRAAAATAGSVVAAISWVLFSAAAVSVECSSCSGGAGDVKGQIGGGMLWRGLEVWQVNVMVRLMSWESCFGARLLRDRGCSTSVARAAVGLRRRWIGAHGCAEARARNSSRSEEVLCSDLGLRRTRGGSQRL